MKRFILIVVGIMFSLVCFADVNSQSLCDKAGIQVKYEKQIKNLNKRAEYYSRKASQEKNKEVAEIYSKCSNAKQKMANGYKQILESAEKCRNIYEISPEAKASICQNGFKNCIFSREKGKHTSTYIKDMQKCVELCLNDAKKAETAGKKTLAEQYNKLADALKGKYEGLGMVSEGEKDFSNARKELKSITGKNKPNV